ncbi:MAG: hypothetical protein KatS3mg102_2441 [Planctomycetota bacterium]|nr:MAG: hypothetical protein KatS3mg102_2441 [Planctomycetota bacterium]
MRGGARVAVAVLGAAAALAGACAGPQGRDGEGPLAALAAAAQADAQRVHQWARALAARFAADAERLEAARAAADEQATLAALQRLADDERALDAFDEAVRTLELVVRYAEQRPQLRLPAAELGRLDRDVERLRAGAAALAEHAAALLRAGAAAAAPGAGAEGGRSAGEAERLRVEIERDRTYLKALRADLLITARFGRPAGEPD